MTIKITHIGTPANEGIWHGCCQQCKSEAEATASDMTNIVVDHREGESFSWEKCPVCGDGENNGYNWMLFRPKV